MTASLSNSLNTPTGFQIDGFVYPQFIGYALRAPTTQDIYNPGTRWQDNSVNPAVQFYTIGAGVWYELPNTSFGVSSVTGTANQILANPTVGAVVLSLIGPYTQASYTAHGVLIGEGTSSIVATAVGATGTLFSGNTGADPTFTASPSVTGSITAGTGFTATTGNLTLNGAASKILINATTAATASVGTTAALSGGALVVNTTAISATSLVFFATHTLGTVTVPQAYRVSARTPNVSFTIQSQDPTDTSTVDYWIIN